MANFREDAYFDEANGVYRWKSNDSIPFDDMLADNGVELPVRNRCNALRAKEIMKFMEEYTRREEEFWTKPEYADARAERLAEQRAAFGNGADVVNIFTGRKYKV